MSQSSTFEVRTSQSTYTVRLFALPILYPATLPEDLPHVIESHQATRISRIIKKSRYCGDGSRGVILPNILCGPTEVMHICAHAEDVAAACILAHEVMERDDNTPLLPVHEALRLPDDFCAKPPACFMVGAIFVEGHGALAWGDEADWRASDAPAQIKFLLGNLGQAPGDQTLPEPGVSVLPPADLKDAVVAALKHVIDSAIDGAIGEPPLARVEFVERGQVMTRANSDRSEVCLSILSMEQDLCYLLSAEALGQDAIDELIAHAHARLATNGTRSLWQGHCDVVH